MDKLPDIKPRLPKELNNLDLLELVCQLHSRALSYPSKHMHEAYMEARMEMESRLSVDKDKEIAEGRFKLPTDKQVVEMAIIFNDGKIDHAKLSDMVGMCQFVIDRLYENGNISIPSSKEEK